MLDKETRGILKINIRNSELNIPKEKRNFLVYPAHGLAPCIIEENDDSIDFIFDTRTLAPAADIFKNRTWEQLRFLVNCAKLESLDREYDFSLSSDNLMIDINLFPYILARDANISPDVDDTVNTANRSFTEKYKALIGSVLLRKYKYEDYLHGGEDLYKKDKLLSQLAALESIESIKERLESEYQKMVDEITQTKKLVDKNKVWVGRILLPVLIATLAASLFFGGRMMLIDIPFRDDLLAASISYMRSDFLAVQWGLRPHEPSALPDDIRLFLSRSYVATEALTDIQRDNILLGLTPLTLPAIFDYWIYLGRLYFEEAASIARRIGDDELLLFAYLKYEVIVRQDINMPVDERTALLVYLENAIDELNEARDGAAAEILGIN